MSAPQHAMRALIGLALAVALAALAWLGREHWWPAPPADHPPPPSAQHATAAPPARPLAAAPAAASAGIAGASRVPRTSAGATGAGRVPRTNAGAAGASRVPRTNAGAAGATRPPQPGPGTADRTAGPTPIASARHETQLRAQARRYVTTLTAPEPEPLAVERADHFVTGDQVIRLLPDSAVRTTTLDAIRADPALGPDTPITVVREAEQVERLTPERLIARSGGALDARIRVLDGDEVQETTVRELLERARRAPDAPIDLVTRTEHYEQTTPRELAARVEDGAGEPIRLVRRGQGLESASIGDLMATRQIPRDSLFYVRTVRPDDTQGIWGIVHDGIIENFARGMAIRRGREINTYRVDIPRDADERLEDRSSSFLGKLIHDKTRASYVYNFTRNRMGRNPHRIVPGQEIVIIGFRPQELIDIYRHFVEQRG